MDTNTKKGWVFWKDNSPHTKLAVNPAMLSGAMSLETLVRELMQNSADSGLDGTTVRLVVSDGYVSGESVFNGLHLADLEKHIQGTIDFANQSNGEKRIVPKSNGQIALLKRGRFRYLKFSDYGTSGIRGVEGYDENLAFWKLLFQEGTSDKGNTNSAGGVGVGKNATFPFSDLATVLYVTRTNEGYGFAGSAHLASSVIDGQTYQMDGNLISYSVSDEDLLDKRDFSTIMPLNLEDAAELSTALFSRDEQGSDVIILGTDNNAKLDGKEWPYLFAAYAIKNFFVAFLNRKIELTIKPNGGTQIEITADTCEQVLTDILALGDDLSAALNNALLEAKLAIATYKGDENNDDFCKLTNVDNALGKITLYMNRSKDVTGKSWCVCRSFGMRTTTYQTRVQKPTFGVVVVETPEGSAYLLKAEAGNHTEYDFSALGDKSAEVSKAIKNFEQWVRNGIANFGKIDSADTDIDLAGFSNFVSLDDEIKTGDDNGGAKPLLEVVNPAAPTRRPKRRLRKRDTGTPDPAQSGDETGGSEEWNHDSDHHANWKHTRQTTGENSGLGEGTETTYNRTINVQATFRDLHLPYGNEVEVLGIVRNANYKTVDLTISAVDEQSQVNSNLPIIDNAWDHNTTTPLTIAGQHTIANVPVDEMGYVHIHVRFHAPFRAMLLENATVKQTVVVKEGPSVQNDQKEETSHEGTK